MHMVTEVSADREALASDERRYRRVIIYASVSILARLASLGRPNETWTVTNDVASPPKSSAGDVGLGLQKGRSEPTRGAHAQSWDVKKHWRC